MKPSITLQWSNTCINSGPTDISIQRSKNFTFNNPNAQIETIVKSNNDGLNPLQEAGWYVDENVHANESYSYRVITHRGDEKSSSVATDLIHCVDHDNDIGYPYGAPATVNVYNIFTSPVMHVDASRVNNININNNETINNPKSLLRHNKLISNLYTRGDPIVDRYQALRRSINIVAKTNTSIQQTNQTKSLDSSQLCYDVSQQTCMNDVTVFAVLYDGYNTPKTNNTFEIVPSYKIKWSNKKFSLQTPQGNNTTTQSNNKTIKTICLRISGSSLHLWHDNETLFNINTETVRKNITWKKNTTYNLIPNNNENICGGICEYMLFDRYINDSQLQTISQYLDNKYDTQNNHINLKNIT